ncbi:hypothetical protein INT43_008364 [Umbelopsis isabellina]|uniref:Uncharacterized protein n=1 Tax=Mortierella isabellina TaxID=91625 RepID=A0A8H7U9E2_MORIS|nr:hypothetical protein INT43_008364 [Umbelopsis isabellina]
MASDHNTLYASPVNAYPEDEQWQGRKGRSNSKLVDIRGRAVGDSVLVALLERPRDMEDLIARNTEFFEAIEHHIRETQGEDAWKEFKQVLLSPRESIPDGAWLDMLIPRLEANPSFIAKFYEMVGYDEYESDSEPEDEAENRAANVPSMPPTAAYDSDSDEEESVELSAVREFPEIQQRLPDIFPPFFRKVRHCLSQGCTSDAVNMSARRNSVQADCLTEDVDVDVAEVRHQHINVDAEGDYDRFIGILQTTRREQPDDNKWQDDVSECLDGWPDLLEELRDIISDVHNAPQM